MRKHLILTLFVLFSSATSLLAQPDEIIKIKPQTLVNDFAAIFTREQVATLERRLVDFNDTTTNVVVIVTVNDLEDYPSWQLAYEIGYSWGVQHEEDANGVVILIKPRNETAGDVAISVGYSLEGVIPDILAKRIIDEQMIPALREGDYYGAVTKALDEMLPLIADEIAYEREKGNPVAAILVFAIFFGLIILIIILIVKKGGQQGGSPG
ncbi:TPM domain-containing protein, partial [Bacteroidales bacterium OttesenSCG-928-E04]|nr:TPM domain-containing protein [Bacteroidales bacterium OttesenSCG-928-E04]